jgi:iron complex outermembrane recepter protein
VSKEIGAHTLKFIGAYRGLRSHVGTDSDGLYFNIVGTDLEVRQRQLTGELQLTRTGGALSYTVGLYALAENARLPPFAPAPDILYTCGCFYFPGGLPVLTVAPRWLRTGSYAIYGQATYKFAAGLSATLGARYTLENKRLKGKAYLLGPELQPTNILVATGSARDHWGSFTYRAGLEYQATADVMAYASIATGFKSGGFNVRGNDRLPNMGFTSFGPETAVTDEVGLHSQWFDRKLRFNAVLFDTEYTNIQLRQLTLVAGEFVNLIENAASARIRGAEAELMAVPLKGLTLTAAYGHLVPHYLDVGRVRGLTLGTPFQRTPRDSLSGSVNYQMPLSSGTLELHGDYSYRSHEQFQITPAPTTRKLMACSARALLTGSVVDCSLRHQCAGPTLSYCRARHSHQPSGFRVFLRRNAAADRHPDRRAILMRGSEDSPAA